MTTKRDNLPTPFQSLGFAGKDKKNSQISVMVMKQHLLMECTTYI